MHLLHGCRKKGVQLPYNTIARPTVRDRDGRQIILLQFNLGHCRKTPWQTVTIVIRWGQRLCPQIDWNIPEINPNWTVLNSGSSDTLRAFWTWIQNPHFDPQTLNEIECGDVTHLWYDIWYLWFEITPGHDIWWYLWFEIATVFEKTQPQVWKLISSDIDERSPNRWFHWCFFPVLKQGWLMLAHFSRQNPPLFRSKFWCSPFRTARISASPQLRSLTFGWQFNQSLENVKLPKGIRATARLLWEIDRNGVEGLSDSL